MESAVATAETLVLQLSQLLASLLGTGWRRLGVKYCLASGLTGSLARSLAAAGCKFQLQVQVSAIPCIEQATVHSSTVKSCQYFVPHASHT